MKVKELIEKLQGLDQERNIWVFYDFPCDCDEPDFHECKEEEADVFKDDGCKPGDYVHYAG